jgi:hypothetical protein
MSSRGFWIRAAGLLAALATFVEMRRSVIARAFAALVALAAPTLAVPAVLYDDGAVNGSVFAFELNGSPPPVVGDSFILGSPSTVTGVTFDSWTHPGDTIIQVDWMIASLPDFTGTTYGSGTATVSSTFLFSSSVFGTTVDVDFNSFPISPGLNLAPGTYWLDLFDAVTANGSNAFWDVNGGPSQVYANLDGGYVTDPAVCAAAGVLQSCADTFQILGTAGTTAAPEPASLPLVAGALAVVGLLRRCANRARATGLKT